MTVLIRIPPYERLIDPTARECFQWIIDYVQAVPLLQGNFEHFELEFNKAETNLFIPHRLGFLPLDIIQTSLTSPSGSATITFKYDKFTTTNFCITTSAACAVRFFAGRYQS